MTPVTVARGELAISRTTAAADTYCTVTTTTYSPTTVRLSFTFLVGESL